MIAVDKLNIECTKSTPEIRFDAEQHKLMIRGQSYPENAFKFYEPILKWVDDYLMQIQGGSGMVLELQLPYINTSSAKCFFMLLDKLEESHQMGKKVAVCWYYNVENDSELECAEEFKEDLTLPFDIIPKKED